MSPRRRTGAAPSAFGSPAARRRTLRAVVLCAGFAPLAALVFRAATDALGANPIEEVTHETGTWALRFLLLSLAVTPARRLTGWRGIQLERRTLGLFAFLYASLHFATYVVFELELDPGAVVESIAERPYVTVGFATFLILCALAATSTRAAARRLGRRWKQLHRLVYAAAIGAVVHYLWLVKSDVLPPLVYGAIVAALLGVRLLWAARKSRRARPTPPADPRVVAGVDPGRAFDASGR